MVDNVQTPQDLSNIEDLKESDASILLNLYVQSTILIGLFTFMLIFRRRNMWLYSPNTRKRPMHPAYKRSESLFGWILPIITTGDVTLLGIIGLDAFMMLQILKMMYRLFFIISLLAIPLFILYYKAATKNRVDVVFLKFSIENVIETKKNWVCILYVYIVTLVCFYIIYIYYKKYVSLRQTYIKSPALLTSVTHLKNLSFELNIDYFEFANLKARTVMLSRVPSFVQTDDELKIFIQALGCGEVDECALVINTKDISSLIEERECLVYDIETEIERAFQNILTKIDLALKNPDINEEEKEFYSKLQEEINKIINLELEEEDKIVKRSEIKEEESEDEEGNIIDDNHENNNINENDKDNADKNKDGEIDRKNNQDENKDEENKDEGNKDEGNKDEENKDEENKDGPVDILIKKFKGDKGFQKITKEKETPEKKENKKLTLEFIHSKNEYLKKKKGVDVISTKFLKLNEIQDRIVEHSKLTMDKSDNKKSSEEVICLMNSENQMYTSTDITKDVSFFTLGHIIRFRKNYHQFALDLPVGTKTGFVTFKNQRSASIINQSLISSKVFSCKALPAPAPTDIIWNNLSLSEVNMYFRRIISKIIFILFNLVFYILVLGLTNLIQLENLEANFPPIKNFTQFKVVRNSFNSVVTPFIYTQMLTMAPVVLSILIYFEGINSYTALSHELLYLHGYFLLLNGFIALLISGTFYTALFEVLKGEMNFGEIANDIAKNLNLLSLFITNTIIQRTLGVSAFIVAKPVRFILVKFIESISKLLFKTVRSRRTKIEDRISPPVKFGFLYPDVLIVFPMALSYAVINPIMLVLACIYFFTVYLVYKHEFLYCLENTNENGGFHWEAVANLTLAAILTFIGCTGCQMFAHDKFVQIFSLLPLIIITVMFKISLNSMFKKGIMHYPLNEQEEIFLDKFTSSVLVERKALVEGWDEDLDPEDKDAIDVELLLEKHRAPQYVSYPYKGFVTKAAKFLLPKGFFNKIRKIHEIDKNDDLKIFKEQKADK